MEYAQIYRDVHPFLQKRLRKRKWLSVIWGVVGIFLFFTVGWLLALVPLVILVTDFVFKNNLNKKGLTLIKAHLIEKIENRASDVSNPECHAHYCFELDIQEAHLFSCLGKMKSNKLLEGLKVLKVDQPMYESFERDTDVTLVVLSNKKCIGYVLNGEVLVP